MRCPWGLSLRGKGPDRYVDRGGLAKPGCDADLVRPTVLEDFGGEALLPRERVAAVQRLVEGCEVCDLAGHCAWSATGAMRPSPKCRARPIAMGPRTVAGNLISTWK